METTSFFEIKSALCEWMETSAVETREIIDFTDELDRRDRLIRSLDQL